MTVVIRAAVPGDASALSALHAASWRSAYAPFVPHEALAAPLDGYMAKKWGVWPEDWMILLAQDGPRVQGFAAVERHEVPLLDNLHVDPRMRGSGIGERLLRHMAAWLRDEGFDALRLDVLDGNTAARRFYCRLGGQEGVAFDDTLLGHPVRMVTTRWSGAAFLALSSDLARQAGKDA